VLLTVCLTFTALWFHAVLRAAMHGSARFEGLAIAQTTEVATKILVALLLIAAFELGVEAVTIGFLVGACVAVVVAFRWVRGLLPRRPAWAPPSAYFASLPLFALTVSLALFTTIDFLMLQFLGRRANVSGDTLALYQVAIMLSRAPYLVGDALTDAAFPYMARRHASSRRSHAWFMGAARWI